MATEVTPGEKASVKVLVREQDLASAFTPDPSLDAYPPVFATARMIATMEVAAARILARHLEQGELSVGVLVDVTHTAATPPGSMVTAEARYVGREGRSYGFEVVAFDEGGEIGRGRHHRAIINAQRLVEGSKKRVPTKG